VGGFLPEVVFDLTNELRLDALNHLTIVGGRPFGGEQVSSYKETDSVGAGQRPKKTPVDSPSHCRLESLIMISLEHAPGTSQQQRLLRTQFIVTVESDSH
jgi:hypothetical protein